MLQLTKNLKKADFSKTQALKKSIKKNPKTCLVKTNHQDSKIKT